MMQVRSVVLLTADPVRRATRDGRLFVTVTATVPAVEDGTFPLRLNLAAFDALAERLLALSVGAMVAVEGTLALTAWSGKDGARHESLRLTVHRLDHGPNGPARLETSRALAGPRSREPVR